MALVQITSTTTNVASPAPKAFGSNNIAGNTLICIGRGSAFSSGTTVTDSQGNTWVKVVDNNYSVQNNYFMAYALNCKAGANTVTVTQTSGLLTFTIAEYSTVLSFDTSTSLASTSATPVSGNITTAHNNELLIGGTFVNGTSTAGSGYTLRAGGTSFAADLEDKTTNTAGTNSASFTVTSQLCAVGIMAFVLSHSITGNAGVAGATVSWSGTATGSTTADGSGNYAIPSLADGSYTVTPSKTGYSFSPVNSAQTMAGADISGVNFTATQIVVATPTFSPVAGSYGPTQSVTVSDTDSGLGGFAMFYTTDGSTPTTGSTPYSGAISVSVSQTIKVLATATGYANSVVGSAAYVINGAQATPTFNPVAGTYGSTQNVTITSTGADTIYYTTDGSTPTTGSTVYSGPVAVASSLTLKALAVRSGFSNSAIGSAAYIIMPTQATPTFNPVAGTYSLAQNVTITSSGADTIYYTTDGSTPTTGSTAYSGPVTVSTSLTLKALAVRTGFSNSAVGSASYIISGGSVAYSVPDCRKPPVGPNTGVTIQGTIQYTGQTSSNPSIPPTDSRAAGAPVDSRLAANKPQNSRTPGTFGPGE